MRKTLTIRLSEAQDSALTKRAHSSGRTRSDIVRELIDKGLQQQPLGRRMGHLRGQITLAAPKGGWRRQIRDRNWR